MALCYMLVAVGVSGCSDDSSTVSRQIAKVSRAYSQAELEAGDRLFLDLRTRYGEDVVVLDNLRILAESFGRTELAFSTSTELARQVAQLKVVEIYRRQLMRTFYQDAAVFLQHNAMGILPPNLHVLLNAQVEMLLGDALQALQTLSLLEPSQLSDELAVEQLRLRVRANILLGNREILDRLMEDASKYFPSEGSRRQFLSSELARIGSGPTLAKLKRHRMPRFQSSSISPKTDATSSKPSDVSTQACHGRSVYNGVELWGSQPVCAPGAAFIGSDVPHINNVTAFFRPPAIPVVGYCCPLFPADILTDETRYVETVCPNDYVATAALPRCSVVERLFQRYSNRGGECEIALECRKINTAKYSLSERSEGLHWGEGFTIWLQKRSVPRAAVPYSIRAVLGRAGKYIWHQHGCIGEPFGSLLVSKSAKRCYGFGFRQLLHRGGSENGSGETPVRLFPACSRRVDPFTESPDCRE